MSETMPSAYPADDGVDWTPALEDDRTSHEPAGDVAETCSCGAKLRSRLGRETGTCATCIADERGRR